VGDKNRCKFIGPLFGGLFLWRWDGYVFAISELQGQGDVHRNENPARLTPSPGVGLHQELSPRRNSRPAPSRVCRLLDDNYRAAYTNLVVTHKGGLFS
jgi:hypothetical protein